MQGHRHIIASLTIVLVAGCSAQPAPDTTSTTTLAETTTSGIRSPFLDVVTEPSNFEAGTVIDVVGLAEDEQNWVGSFPSNDVEFFGRLWEFDRLDAGFVSLGEAARYLDGEVWEKVEGEEQPGYFPQEQTGVVGEPSDITADLGSLEAASADELILLIAETIAAENGLEPIQITRREFGGREVYYDLIGGEDATSRGLRVRIVVEEAGDVFVTSLVEQSPICVAGIDDSGNCK